MEFRSMGRRTKSVELTSVDIVLDDFEDKFRSLSTREQKETTPIVVNDGLDLENLSEKAMRVLGLGKYDSKKKRRKLISRSSTFNFSRRSST